MKRLFRCTSLLVFVGIVAAFQSPIHLSGRPVPQSRSCTQKAAQMSVAGSGSKALEGKRVLVTGGGRGIGRAIALLCAEAGAQVAILARTDSELNEVAAES